MRNKKISVITLTWNSESTVADTIKSIQKQSYDNYEHIIIDNESTDKTLDLIRDLYSNDNNKLKIISEKDKGISDAFNKGIKNSTGDIVVFLNSDDMYESHNVFEEVMNAFSDSDVMYVHGDMIFEDDLYGTNRRKPLLCSLEEAMPYNHPTFFVRRELYEKHGVFDLKYKYTMDFHFICRLYKTPVEPRYKSKYISKIPFVRMRAGGVSWKYEFESLSELENALKEYGFFTKRAMTFINNRKLRVKVRKIITGLRLNFFVTLWRKWKWRS